ncbi:MAG: ATP-binding protein [Candidatus Endonucleobacter sp. (ex Gigantidas childressi)]|nr:ATP-binding protein [Candidatus Endonucleobacter sp. (ex Gigantidas childressi)]
MEYKVPRLVIWPWRSLFWRIFLWFWLAMLAMLITLFISFAATVDPSDFVSERRELFSELEVVSRRIEGLTQCLVHLQNFQIPGSGYFLFDLKGDLLGNSIISKELLQAYQKTVSALDPIIVFKQGVLVVGPHRVILNDQLYQLYLTKEIPRLIHWRVQQILARHWHLVIIALGVSFLLCIILARYLVGPIRQLQSASRKLAKGDLTTRVDSKVAQRKDELGELGRDFDVMAEQLEFLLNSKERLLRDVSHELRSPLTRLQLSLALARRKTPEACVEHNRIECEVERLDQLIGQIIRFSRIQHGVLEHGMEQVDLQELVRQLVNDGDFEAQSCHKSVILIRSSEIKIWAVRDFTSSAIENIIRNAIRFTPKESNVEVSLEEEAQQAVIKVRDYGPGVPEETLKSLFEPFFRVDETRGKENNGMGLGMAIAQSAISFHKGSITVNNAAPGLQVEIRMNLLEL